MNIRSVYCIAVLINMHLPDLNHFYDVRSQNRNLESVEKDIIHFVIPVSLFPGVFEAITLSDNTSF